MSQPRRILFSIETADRWIFEAYKAFFDSLKGDGRFELYCTVWGIGEPAPTLAEYRTIDYKLVPSNRLFNPEAGPFAWSDKELAEQVHRLSLWHSPTQLIERFSIFRAVLNLIEPDVAIVWNGMVDIRGMVREHLSRLDIPYFYAEKGMLPGSWYIDHLGINAASSLDSSCLGEKLDSSEQEQIESYIHNIIHSGSSAWDQPSRIKGQSLKEKLKIPTDRPVIFFPGQVDQDVNITTFSPFRSVAEAVGFVLDAAAGQTTILLKPHPKAKPSSRDSLMRLSQQHENLFIIPDGNVWDLIEAADMVVSINSTVAFEALLRKKKVLLLGDSVLSKVGLAEKTERSRLAGTIAAYIRTPFERLFDYSKVLRFVKFLREHYYVFKDSRTLPAAIISRLEDRAKCPAPKRFESEQILEMVYPQADPCQPNGSVDIDTNEAAVKLFLMAQAEFKKANFTSAGRYIQQYRSTIDYSKLPRTVFKKHRDEAINVSVVVVTYNRTEQLKKCLESLSRQETSDFEVTVVDNGRTNIAGLEHHIDQYVRCPANFNLSEGRNIGVHFARGEIIVFLDDDAVVPSNYISSIKAAFDAYEIYGLRGKALPKSDPQANKGAKGYDRGERAFPTFCDQEGNSAFLRKIYLAMGGMDPLLFGHEGSDLTYRICRKYKALNKVIYWPAAIIYHDAAPAEVQESKRSRYRLMEDYLRFKHNTNIWDLRRVIETQPLPVAADGRTVPTDEPGWLKASSHATKVPPVVLVVYNRPMHTLEVLKKLREHNITNLYIFSDAPKSSQDAQAVALVRRLVHSIDWTKPKIIERAENFGLARNITEALDYVFERCDRLILLEDDCVPQRYFFEFMYACLEKYENNPKVFGICGYTVPLPEQLLQSYPYDLYFSPRIGSWGWATWRRAWRHYEKDLHKLIETANSNNIDLTQGGTDIPVLIEKFITGELKDVWTLNWVLSVYVNDGVYIYPTKSHIKNIGTDGTGQHCSRTTKYDPVCCDTKPRRYPSEVFLEPQIMDNFRSYYAASPQESRKALHLLGAAPPRRSLRISLINTVDKKGGAARVAWMLKQGLKARGHRTKMFVGQRYSDDPDVAVITNSDIDGSNQYKSEGFLDYDVKSTFSLVQNPQIKSSHLLHFHNLHGGYFNLFALPGLAEMKPCLWTLHDMQALTGHCAYAFDCNRWQKGCGDCPDLQTYPAITRDQTARMWEDKRRIYQQSDLEIIVPSLWLKGLVEKSILADKKVHLIYNGVDEQFYRPFDKQSVRRMFKVPSSAVIIGFVANKGLAERRKGGDFILQAYKYLVQKYRNCFFVCIGGTCGNVPKERFVQVPFVADENKLVQLYNLMDIFLFPTLADNCPLVVLEVMGCGVPIVSFRTGGVGELVEHERTGLLAKRGDAEELVKMTETLLTNQNLRNQFGASARQKLLQNFTLARMIDEHERLYERVLERAEKQSYRPAGNRVTVPAKEPDRKEKYIVSAIVSTYNSERFLRGCLEDLENQTIADKLEIIVVNSGSEQNEEQIVKEFQRRYDNIVYIKTDRRESVYAAWNRGIKVARGKFITNANTDDRHRKDALEIMAKTLQANPDIALVYADQIRTDTPNDTFENHHGTELLKRPPYSRDRLLFGCCVGSQPMWRKSLHEQFGYFDESLTCAGDWDFWLRISQKYDFKHIPEYLGLYYYNPEGIEHSRKIHSLYERYIVGKRYGNPYISVIDRYNRADNVLVSVVMPAYNSSRYIAEAIESVLIQNYRNFELIIVDDGSTDKTADIVHSFEADKIRYFHKEHSGPAGARNLAIEKSRGRFIVILDADDMITPDFIARHLQEFEKVPEADLVYCDDRLIDENGKTIRVIERPEYTNQDNLIRDLFRCGYPVVPFRTFIKREVFEKIGLYDEQLLVAEDYDMMRRFLKHNLKAHHLPAALYLRRLRPQSLSRLPSPYKAKSHFAAMNRFLETFSHRQLFPEVDWDSIPAELVPLQARCCATGAYLAVARAYMQTDVPLYAEAAVSLACSQLEQWEETGLESSRIQELRNKCETVRRACRQLASKRAFSMK